MLYSKIRSAVLTFLLAIALSSVFASSAMAAWGDLDPTFAGTGFLSNVPAGASLAQATAVTIQDDGKIVVAGLQLGAADGTLYLQRLLPSGALDPTFGTGGTFFFTALGPGKQSTAYSLAMQPDGKILVAGKADVGSYDGTLLLRLNPNGTLDSNADSTPGDFNVTGYLAGNLGSGDAQFNDVKLDGTDIVVGGTYKDGSSNPHPAVRKFNSSGAIVNPYTSTATSAIAGWVLVSYEDSVKVLIPSAGRVFVAFDNYDSPSMQHKARVYSLLASGSVDSSYGTSGVATAPGDFTTNDALLDNGRVVLAGDSYPTPSDSYRTATARFLTTGFPDASFGTGGVKTLDVTPGNRSGVFSFQRLPDGRLVELNLSFDDPGGSIPFATVSVLGTDGTPVAGFGTAGVHRYTEFGTRVYPSGLALQSDGKAILVGGAIAGLTQTTLIARIKGEHTDDPVPSNPTSKITSPSKSKYKASKLKSFKGTATAVGAIKKVEIALQRVDSKLLKKKKRCLWLSSNKAKFKKVKAVKKKCSAPKWLKATGTTAWSYKLKKKLAKGSYVLSVRATAADGVVQAKPTTKKFKIT